MADQTPNGAQGSRRQASTDGLARALVHTMRSEADIRAQRLSKPSTIGTVISASPLRIQTEMQFYDGIELTEKDLLFLSGTVLEDGETVLLIRTITDQIVCMPIAAPGLSATGGPEAGTDTIVTPPGTPGAYPLVPTPSPVGGGGDLVIAKALTYAGQVTENLGANKGTQINAWSADWGWASGGQPWCGVFVAAMYKEAGVDDGGLAHPSVLEIWRRAHLANRLAAIPVKGCMCLYGEFDATGKMVDGSHGHVTLYIDGPVQNAHTIGGNESNGVVDGHHNLTPLAGSRVGMCWAFAVPESLTVAAVDAVDAPTGTGAPDGTYTRVP